MQLLPTLPAPSGRLAYRRGSTHTRQLDAARRPSAQHAQHQQQPLQPSLPAQHASSSSSRRGSVAAAAVKQPTSSNVPKYQPTSARDAVETGLQEFRGKAYAEAVRLYDAAMALGPNEDEARAALYNKGCALAKLRQWRPASDAVTSAINDYNLKLSVALADDDLQELRDTREWADALTDVKGGLSRNSKIDLRTEAKAPFRFPRIVILGSLGVGAAAGLVIILFRLATSLKGGEGAPDLSETLQNLAVNVAALAVIGTVLYRDVKGKQKQIKVTEREEFLGRLQVDMGNQRVLPLLRFRGQVRPVIISGSRRYVESVLRAAEPYYTGLRERGVSVVPVILDEVEAARRLGTSTGEVDPAEKIRRLKMEMRGEKPDSSKGFGGRGGSSKDESAAMEEKEKASTSSVSEADRKWKLVPHQVTEWKDWVDEQRQFAMLPAGTGDMYVQIQLDGTVRSSGLGMPPWGKFMDDLPTLDSIRTTFTDGIGPNE